MKVKKTEVFKVVRVHPDGSLQSAWFSNRHWLPLGLSKKYQVGKWTRGNGTKLMVFDTILNAIRWARGKGEDFKFFKAVATNVSTVKRIGNTGAVGNSIHTKQQAREVFLLFWKTLCWDNHAYGLDEVPPIGTLTATSVMLTEEVKNEIDS